jgi:hypothetical protein
MAVASSEVEARGCAPMKIRKELFATQHRDLVEPFLQPPARPAARLIAKARASALVASPWGVRRKARCQESARARGPFAAKRCATSRG